MDVCLDLLFEGLNVLEVVHKNSNRIPINHLEGAFRICRKMLLLVGIEARFIRGGNFSIFLWLLCEAGGVLSQDYVQVCPVTCQDGMCRTIIWSPRLY